MDIKNRAYKKWIMREGVDVPGMAKLFTSCLMKKHKMAFEIMAEAKATPDQSGVNKAVEFIMTQLK